MLIHIYYEGLEEERLQALADISEEGLADPPPKGGDFSASKLYVLWSHIGDRDDEADRNQAQTWGWKHFDTPEECAEYLMSLGHGPTELKLGSGSPPDPGNSPEWMVVRYENDDTALLGGEMVLSFTIYAYGQDGEVIELARLLKNVG